MVSKYFPPFNKIMVLQPYHSSVSINKGIDKRSFIDTISINSNPFEIYSFWWNSFSFLPQLGISLNFRQKHGIIDLG